MLREGLKQETINGAAQLFLAICHKHPVSDSLSQYLLALVFFHIFGTFILFVLCFFVFFLNSGCDPPSPLPLLIL